jgi:CheY-like chemotaxis protein
VKNYGEALSVGQTQEFDLVTSDIGLPDGNGYELMHVLQALSPINGIALSGYGMKADVDRSEAAGFSAHLTKPCDLSVLNATIERFYHNLHSSVLAKLARRNLI